MEKNYEEMAREYLRGIGHMDEHDICDKKELFELAIAYEWAFLERAKETCETCNKKPSCGYLMLMKETMESPSAGEDWGYDKFGCIFHSRIVEVEK